ncbi:signal transduction histidine kinase/CHASE1-domain containing sensor protein [Sulfitobacter undariae]|uniref:histidine kinase n=1 Tax=Sulfitobacter undariae TaxID=1563671 RepID=A0A7W6H270_9RHOB|nr:ATP-binding protein [Sulfitobacter undariae]MBB3995523.1 signal transduction histidine kinase/CHASE1-domain containing sensor protein [Sulfitobacter undariae]
MGFFLGLSFFSFSLVHKIAQSRSQEAFQVMVEQSLTSLDRRFEGYSRVLDGLNGLVMASDNVTGLEMSNFTKALNTNDNLFVPDAIGLASAVPEENSVRGNLFALTDNPSQFKTSPTTLQVDRFIVQYIEPLASHQMFLGLDLANNPDLLAIARKARDTGQTLLAGNFPNLVPKIGDSRLLLLKPIYKPLQITYPLNPQKRDFIGFAFAVLNVENIFTDLTTTQREMIGIQAEFNTGTAIYNTKTIPATGIDAPEYSSRQSFEKFGQVFSMSLRSTPKFDALQPFRVRWIVLTLGLLITALISTVLRVLIKKNQTIAVTVAQKTRDLETQDKEKRSILENAMLAILSVNKSWEILHVNEAALKLLLPLTSEMCLLKIPLNELLPDLDLQSVDGWSKLQVSSTTGKAEPLIFEVEKKTWFTAEGEERITFLMRDITTIERHAKEIVEAEHRWSLALMSVQIGVFDIDLKHGTSVVSDTWRKNMGSEPLAKCKNPYQEQMVRMHSDDLAFFKKAEMDCIEGRTDRAEVRFRVKGGNDEWLWIKSDAVVVERAPDGTAIRMLGIQMDVTETLKLERMKRDFIATVSHELRTPLTSIKGALGLLQAQSQAGKPKGSDRLIEIALSNSDRLASLINDILDMEKMNSGNLNVEVNSFDLNEILNDASQQIETYASQWNVRVEVQRLEVEQMISTDKKRVIQVLTNLLSNACKFAHSETTVRLTVEALPTHIKISVINSGPSIPEEFRNKIFQPFSQADSSDARQRGGTGLGLSISRTLIDLMGGTIGFESEPDQETVFWFTCPLMDASEAV